MTSVASRVLIMPSSAQTLMSLSHVVFLIVGEINSASKLASDWCCLVLVQGLAEGQVADTPIEKWPTFSTMQRQVVCTSALRFSGTNVDAISKGSQVSGGVKGASNYRG
jgi:hypothetical protein